MTNSSPIVSIFPNVYDKVPAYVTVDEALARIKNGNSAPRIAEVRDAMDKVKREALKKSLPAVVWAGEMTTRGDKNLKTHSGYLCLDFDKLDCVGEKLAQMQAFPHTYAAWVSPSANGVKCLVRIADGSKHRQHFAAICEVFPDVDPSGVNEERLCFESHDPHLYHNPSATPFTGIVEVKTYTDKVQVGTDAETFSKLLVWITNKHGAFAAGSRNIFVFRLAGACCRFGLSLEAASDLIASEYPTGNDFTHRELLTAIKSAYRANASQAGTACFEREQLVTIKTRKEISVKDLPASDPDAPVRDVIYGADVRGQALNIYHNGYGSIRGIGVEEFDQRWKPKRGEISLLTGLANYGKSAHWRWYKLMRAILYGEKFASFSPEDNPPQEYYHDFVEMLLGCNCTPSNPNRPSIEQYEAAYDWVSRHIFYLYPQDDAPTPEYVLERFLEIIVKEKVDGISIDPFNQMSNDYGARSDKYLETVLNMFARFAQKNDVYFLIIAHPKQMTAKGDGNFSVPGRFDLNDGAMWSNKMDNCMTYHRPVGESDPNNPVCTLTSWKIKRPKMVGRKGMVEFRYVAATRRFEFKGEGGRMDDPMARALVTAGLPFAKPYEPVRDNPRAGINTVIIKSKNIHDVPADSPYASNGHAFSESEINGWQP